MRRAFLLERRVRGLPSVIPNVGRLQIVLNVLGFAHNHFSFSRLYHDSTIRHLNEKCPMKGHLKLFAESEGFEPPDLLQSTVFKTAAIDHSANSPGAKVQIRC